MSSFTHPQHCWKSSRFTWPAFRLLSMVQPNIYWRVSGSGWSYFTSAWHKKQQTNAWIYRNNMTFFNWFLLQASQMQWEHCWLCLQKFFFYLIDRKTEKIWINYKSKNEGTKDSWDLWRIGELELKTVVWLVFRWSSSTNYQPGNDYRLIGVHSAIQEYKKLLRG